VQTNVVCSQYYTYWDFPINIISSSWHASEFWRKFGKIWSDTTLVESSQPTYYIPRDKIRDFKRDINSWVYFFSYVFFSFTFSSASLPPPLSLRVVPLLFSLVFICISHGAALSSHCISFASLLFILVLLGFIWLNFWILPWSFSVRKLFGCLGWMPGSIPISSLCKSLAIL